MEECTVQGKIMRAPFDYALLEEISMRASAGGHDVSATLKWIAEQRTNQAMMSAIQASWQRSDLPIRCWAEDIVDCCVWVNDAGTDLRINPQFDVPSYPQVLQAAPLSDADISHVLVDLPKDIHSFLRHIAITSPGLSLNEVGELMPPECLWDRLGVMRAWIQDRGITPELCEEYKCVFPGDERFVLEVAHNGQACYYVIDRDGGLYYHEYGDLPGLLPCTVGIQTMVERYLEDPEVLLNPYLAGWVEYPQ